MESLELMLSPMIFQANHIDTKRISEQEIALMDRIRNYKFNLLTKHNYSIQADFVRPVIVESWIRSYNYGLNMFDYNHAPVLSRTEFEELSHRKSIFLKAADPYIQQLESILTNTDSIIYLTDEQGVFMRVLVGNSKQLAEQNERFQIVEGSVWTEKTVGTCGHTLSLVLGIPIQICGPEHYCEKHGEITCSSAPIYDNNNMLAGTLQIVTPSYIQQNSHTLALVITIAGAIQNELRYKLNNKLLGLTWEMADEAVITMNEDGKILQINETARRLFAGINRDLPGMKIEKLLGNQPLIKSALKNGKQVNDMLIECEPFKQKLICSIKSLTDGGIHYGYMMTLKKPHILKKETNSYGSAKHKFTFARIVGNAPPFAEAVQYAKRFAQRDDSILIQGESGTGKEVIAQAIHNESRPDGPFIAVNCGAIARSLIESELFGYEKGSFTGAERQGRAGKIELANGGTLFLDEIGDLPLELQSVLLRVIEEKQVIRIGGSRYIDVDFRLIAATNKDLIDLVRNNQFREDLYFRLSVFTLKLPPLRERKSDIYSLAKHFIQEIAERQHIEPPALSSAAKCLLFEYDWPGNVRQLKNAMTYAMSIHSGGVIRPENLPPLIKDAMKNKLPAPKLTGQTRSMNEMERDIILNVLEKNSHCISQAAKNLGISRATLYRKMKKYNIS